MALAEFQIEENITGATKVKDADSALQKNMVGVKHFLNGTDGTGDGVSNYSGVGIVDEIAVQVDAITTDFTYAYDSGTKTLTITDTP